jgi:putative nucleotidyltransferase with HDIG domain
LTYLLQVLDDPQAQERLAAELLSADPELRRAVLRQVGTPDSGEVVETVLRLGLPRLKTIVITSLVCEPLNQALPGYRLAAGELWRHSLATAHIAFRLAQELCFQSPEEAYLAGLLHDLGKLLLDPLVSEDYDRFVERLWKRKMQLCQVEAQLFELDHAGVGELVAAAWGQPDSLIEAIRCHHAPLAAKTRPELAALVNVANAFTPPGSLGLSALAARRVSPDSLALLQLDQPGLERLRAAVLPLDDGLIALAETPASYPFQLLV